MKTQRLIALQQWAQQILDKPIFNFTPLAGDASFRRYFRIQLHEQTIIAVDAPPDRENSAPFIAIARSFAQLGIDVPQIFAADMAQGFLLISDLGDRLYLRELNPQNAESLYKNALHTLAVIQSCEKIEGWSLPTFDRTFIIKEWRLFQDWLLQQHWNLQLNTHEQHLLFDACEILIESTLAQPKVCVHRDYHSRNLLILQENKVGVLDFQDAVWGPITYDAVSLLRDCYIAWPRSDVEQWFNYFYLQIQEIRPLKNISFPQLLHWFNLSGIQRHLKAVGIFARLNHLYKKPDYLNDIPRSLNYVLEVSADYPELANFRRFLQSHAIPCITENLSL